MTGRLFSLALVIISPIVLIRIGNLTVIRLGHMVEPAVNYLNFHRTHSTTKRVFDIIFIDPVADSVNPFMWGKIKERLPVSDRVFVHKFLAFALPGIIRNRNYLPLNSAKDFFIAVQRPPVFALSDTDMQRGQDILRQLGVPPASWYVCVANRDHAYLNAVAPNKDWAYHDFRDSSVHNLIGAAEEVVARGGFVFRMGNFAAEPWPGEGLNVIDVPSLPCDPFLDVFLSATCRFFISSNSGINVLPMAFGRPTSSTNFIPLTRMAPPCRGYTLPKMFRDATTKEVIHFREVRDKGLFTLALDRTLQQSIGYANLGLDVMENDAEDIRGLCRDMFEYDDPSEVPADIQKLQRFYEREYMGADNPYIGAPLAPSFIIRHRHLIE